MVWYVASSFPEELEQLQTENKAPDADWNPKCGTCHKPSLQRGEVLKSELARGRQAIPAVESPRFDVSRQSSPFDEKPRKAVDEVLHRQARRFFSCYISLYDFKKGKI